jgi:CheY-like chemotaxis protein
MPTVMVVDDAPLTRSTLKRLLVREGYEAVTAQGGSEALDKLEHQQMPDLILLDVHMPDLDGLELLERLHAHPQWRALPVVMLSAESDAHTVHRANQLGAKAYLVKATFSVHEMMQQVRSLTKYMPS